LDITSSQILPEPKPAETKWPFGRQIQKSSRARSEAVGKYFYKQLTRHGALTVDQLIRLHHGILGRSQVYVRLRKLYDQGYVRRASHPTKPIDAYFVTEKGYRAVLDPEDELPFNIREQDLEHTVACTEAMINFVYTPAVLGIATEFEMHPEDMKKFISGRRPDATLLVKVREHDWNFAVEVETALKSRFRIKEILEAYREATESKYRYCQALIVIATRPNIFNAYDEEIKKLSRDTQDGIFLMSDTSLPELRKISWGGRVLFPGFASYSERTESGGRIGFSPMYPDIRENLGLPNTPIGPYPVTDLPFESPEGSDEAANSEDYSNG